MGPGSYTSLISLLAQQQLPIVRGGGYVKKVLLALPPLRLRIGSGETPAADPWTGEQSPVPDAPGELSDNIGAIDRSACKLTGRAAVWLVFMLFHRLRLKHAIWCKLSCPCGIICWLMGFWNRRRHFPCRIWQQPNSRPTTADSCRLAVNWGCCHIFDKGILVSAIYFMQILESRAVVNKTLLFEIKFYEQYLFKFLNLY